jgi:hypothetical protein
MNVNLREFLHRTMAIDYTHRNIMAVLRYSTGEEPRIKIQFAFFVAGMK